MAVNGDPMFCRGGCWFPIDPVSFGRPSEELQATLTLAREAGHEHGPDPRRDGVRGRAVLRRLCDRLGLLVWQDAMFAFLDPPDDAEFLAVVAEELTGVFSSAGRPSVAERGLRRPGAGGAAGHVRPVAAPVAATLADEVVAGRRRSAGWPGVPYVTS